MVNMKKYTFGIATKKLIALIMCGLITMPTLTSCDATPDYNAEGIAVDSADRFRDTRILANSLYQSGLISEDSYNTIMDTTKSVSSIIGSTMKAMETEDTDALGNTNEVQRAWANIAGLKIFYNNNFSGESNTYKEDTFNLSQAVIAFKPVNHSKPGNTLDDALNLDSGSYVHEADTSEDLLGQPWVGSLSSKNDGNDLYGDDNWNGTRGMPKKVKNLQGSEMLRCLVNLMCKHKMIFAVDENIANTHIDRWFVKGAYVNHDRTIISLDVPYNTWGYFQSWDGSKGTTSGIIEDVVSGGNKASSDLNTSRNALVTALNENKVNSQQNAEIKWVNEDTYFAGLTKKNGVGYTLSTYGNASTEANGNSMYSHKLVTVPGLNAETTYIPIDTKYPYSAINSTDNHTYESHGTLEPTKKKKSEDVYADRAYDYNQDVCFPINIVPPSVVDEFEAALDLPVYTVRTDKLQLGSYGSIRKMITDNSQTEQMLKEYFTPAVGGPMSGGNITSSSAGKLTLRDILYAECQKMANGNDEYLNYLLHTDNIIMTSTWNDNPVTWNTYNEYNDDYTEIRNSYSSYGVKNEIGKDIVFCQKIGSEGQVTPVMAVRVNEFNVTYCSLLNSLLGLFNDSTMTKTSAVNGVDCSRYKLVHNSNGEAIGIVLLEYPVDAITGFESNKDGTVKAVFADSGMGINVGSGKIIKYQYTGGKGVYSFSKEGVYVSDIASIYYTPGSGIALGTTIKALGSKPTPIGLVGDTITYQKGHYSIDEQNNSSATISQEYGIYAPRFYLSTYLEALYAPNLTNDSSWVLFGRRFNLYGAGYGPNDHPEEQILNNRSVTLKDGTVMDVSEKTLKYRPDDVIGSYIDGDGNLLSYEGEDLKIKLSDLCGVYQVDYSGTNEDFIKYFSTSNETIDDIGAASEQHTVTELKHQAINPNSSDYQHITTSYMFASNDIGKVDADAEINYATNQRSDIEQVLLNLNYINTESSVAKSLLGTMESTSNNQGSMTDYVAQQSNSEATTLTVDASAIKMRNRFWAMAVRKSIFSDEIYNGWIANKETESVKGESLAWWNAYLESNAFAYRITASTFNTYTRKNYKNQMIARGEIEDYDIGTIGDIENYYDQEAKKERVQNIRTVFKIVGYIIIAFAFILILLWAIDTNTDLGLNLLQKVTFGNWIAIKYASDIPDNRNMDKKYITGGKIVIRSMILVAVGLAIIVVNAFDIVRILVDTFGTIGKTIEDIIKGK